ncbi:MotA/TolQ/ExbB proton channel family protein [Ramlibacter terrae]|uniref:Biopolymer transport protein ExbB n=1 Tax=Ramlibacter terrae TaxID=2732511 RepID=A0ABX6P024_9BURK|nr:MotA/TolQ/ExbB proton channel family protein [Ramlibacter terrae]
MVASQPPVRRFHALFRSRADGAPTDPGPRRRQPLRTGRPLVARRFRRPGHLAGAGDHVAGELVRAGQQADRAVAHGRAGQGGQRQLLEGRHGAAGRRRAAGRQPLPLHRGVGAGSHPQARRPDRQGRPQHRVAQSIERAVGTVHSRTQEGLAVLATVGSTAPFVGLFGTVWGIYNALVRIGASGQASIDKVAGPVGEALIMTALGLAVAVPAVLGYNWLVRRNKVAMDTVRAFGSDLHTVLLASGTRES